MTEPDREVPEEPTEQAEEEDAELHGGTGTKKGGGFGGGATLPIEPPAPE